MRAGNLERNKQEYYQDVADEKEILELKDREKNIRDEVYRLQRKNMILTANELAKQNDIIGRETLVLDFFDKGRDDNTDIQDSRIARAKSSIEELAESSRDAYFVVHGLELRDNINELKNGRMVETPYVKESMEKLSDNMQKGQPSFIHGHLGSGKTELATTVAQKVAMSQVAKEQAWVEYEKYYEEHPEIFDDIENANNIFYKMYKKAGHDLEKKIAAGVLSGDAARWIPLMISGSKDLTTQDLYTEKSLKLAHYNSGTMSEEMQKYNNEYQEWRKNHVSDSPEEEARAAAEFLELYKSQNQAFGTEVENIEKELTRAIKEGRPLILDEVNAIPAGILISLNDILQKRPGQSCFVPGVGMTKIQSGFSITMTGNLDIGKVEYAGTNELNPAFLSRLDIMEYDYLPQSVEGSLNDKNRKSEEDELYRVMISYLADEKGNLRLPNIDENVTKIYHLAQFAKLSQEIFSGKHVEINNGGLGYRAELKRSVLSMRNVLRVLDEWNKGREMDLDTALWKGFISGITDNNEKNLLLQLAHDRFGFFDNENGWEFNAKKPGEISTFYDDNRARLSETFRTSPLEFYSTAQVVDLVFGDRPERKESDYPDLEEIARQMQNQSEMSDEEKEALFNKTQEYLNLLEKEIGALDVLGEQCGCKNSEPSFVKEQ